MEKLPKALPSSLARAKKGLFFLILILFILIPKAGFCDPGSDEVELEEVVVEEQKAQVNEGSRDSAAFSTVITEKDIQDRYTSVPELLSESVGVHVRSLGGLGDSAVVSIRGSTSEQVQIYLDGVPLNLAQGGAVDLSNIPVENIERIEIYRGSAPARYNVPSIGGVIDIRTKTAGPKAVNSISGSYGSFGTGEVAVTRTQKIKKFDYTASYIYSRGIGDFWYIDDNGTPLNPRDDAWTQRLNNGFISHNALIKLGYDLPAGLRVEFVNNFYRKDEGIPGLGSNTSLFANLSTTRNLSSVRLLGRDTLLSNLDLELAGMIAYTKHQYEDRFNEIGLGRQDTDNDTLAEGLEAIATYYWMMAPWVLHTFSVSIQYWHESFSPENFLAQDPIGATSKRDSVTVSFEDEMSFLDDRIVFNPSGTFMYVNNNLNNGDTSLANPGSFENNSNLAEFTGKGGLKVAIIKDVLFVKGNIGKYFRIPSFLELFGDRGFLVGNPTLLPEDGWNWDVGAKVIFSEISFIDSLFLEAAYFQNHVDNLIQFIQTSQYTARAENISSAFIDGVEVSGGITLLGHFRNDFNYTYMYAEDTSNNLATRGNILPGRPFHEVNVHVEYFDRWDPHVAWKIYYDFAYIEGNFLDVSNFILTDDRYIHNAGVSVTLVEHLILTFEGKNLGNNQVVDFAGFPVPGRGYYGKAEIIF